MPKASRLFIDYACYHIITRGNQKQMIFRNEDNFPNYLRMLKKALKRYFIQLYAYCLMPNHVHLLIEPKSLSDMSKCMHSINRGYTGYFNTEYEKVGHLWQGRYKSKPILKGRYLINCAEYIEGNPVRANLTTDPALYQWSSYRERCLLAGKSMLDEMVIDQRQDKREEKEMEGALAILN